MSTVHVIGAGLAGLAAALSLAQAGRQVLLYEAGPAAGGRCRSYFDRGLGLRLDNGNHLLLSGNRRAMEYLEQIGARHTMGGPGVARFAFMDLATGERWTVAPGRSRVPWWVMSRRRRVPGTSLRDYLALLALRRAGSEATVAGVLAHSGALYHRLLEPLAIATLNTPPDRALACLMARVMQDTLMQGGGACVPSFPRSGMSESFIDPAVSWLKARGASLMLGRRVAGLRTAAGRVTGIETADDCAPVAGDDAVVLATPAWVAAELLPGLVVPNQFEAILNVHFRATAAPSAESFTGLVGGTAEWVFVKPGVLSVTISAASALADLPAEEIAARTWPDVRATFGLDAPMPPVRVVKERRATFAATAEQEGRRPPARTGLANLMLAGDWTATGLPATIEGAIKSGRVAASALLAA